LSLGAFRLAVQAKLQTELGIEFVGGKLEGPMGERDIGCCWPEGASESEETIVIQNLQVRARVFKQYNRSEEPETPQDPADLEALVLAMQTSLNDRQLLGVGGEYFARVTEVDVDVDRNMVDARIVSYGANVAVSAA
jgi:hypothetical protein